MNEENLTLIAKLLHAAGMRPGQLSARAEKEKEADSKRYAARDCLRKALQDYLVMKKFEEIREELT